MGPREVATEVVTDKKLRTTSGDLVRYTQLLLTIVSQWKPHHQHPRCPRVGDRAPWGLSFSYLLNFCHALRILQGSSSLVFTGNRTASGTRYLARALGWPPSNSQSSAPLTRGMIFWGALTPCSWASWGKLRQQLSGTLASRSPGSWNQVRRDRTREQWVLSQAFQRQRATSASHSWATASEEQQGMKSAIFFKVQVYSVNLGYPHHSVIHYALCSED